MIIMIELVKSSVVFNEENHTYMLGEKQLQGITGMISRQLFPDKYKDVPDFVLKRAAEKGSLIHAQCQFVDATGLPPESIEAAKWSYPHPLTLSIAKTGLPCKLFVKKQT